MGCCDGDRKEKPVDPEHKFTYINLADFRSKSCLNYMAYFGIYSGTLISVACYVADIYTAVILLAYNRWSSEALNANSVIQFSTAKIVFCTCIFLSFALLAFDWWVAVKVIKSDGVANAYMNVIAVRWNCIRGGKGKGDTGWRRFLVFSRLTKSRGFVDYIAIFTYFAFKGWARILFAEGPRIVINTLTFISVTKADEIVKNQSNALSAFEEFFGKFGVLYKENKLQVIVLGTMAFTTIMWVFAMLRLLIASFLYICYLWHAMGGRVSLRKYCKERIDTRMGEIVQKKHDKALAREKKENALLRHQPTIPILDLEAKVAPSSSFGSNPNAMSSTAKLIQNQPSPPQSVIYPPSSMPINMHREPTLPNISEFDRRSPAPVAPLPMSHTPAPAYQSSQPSYQPSQIPAPTYDLAENRQPPPSRSLTTRTNNSYSSNIAMVDYEREKQQEQQQQPWVEPPHAALGGEYIPPRDFQRRQEMEMQHARHNGHGPPPPREPPYQMQHLPPSATGRTTFVADRIARDPYSQHSAPQPPPGRFPIQSREPQFRAPPPRSHTADPIDSNYSSRHEYNSESSYGPSSGYRQQQPPARSHTTAPMDSSYGNNNFSNSNRPAYAGRRNYEPARLPPQQRGPPPAASAGSRYPPLRAGTAPPQQQQAYNPPPPARLGTAPPPQQQSFDGPFNPLPSRSETVPPPRAAGFDNTYPTRPPVRSGENSGGYSNGASGPMV